MNDAFYESLSTWSQIVASVLFIVVLVYLWRRFIAPAVIASQARKNAELAEIEQRRDEARANVDVAQRGTTEADADARSILARADADAARLAERIFHDARAEGERVVRNAEGELERARAAARDQLRTELLDRAMQLARTAAARLDDATNRRLVAEAVDTAERSEPA